MDDQNLGELDYASQTVDSKASDEQLPARLDIDLIRGIAVRAKATPRFWLEPLNQIELDTDPQWLITGLMPSTGLHVLYGAPGTGKSFLALSAALHVAAGKPWGGRNVRKGGVVYVASEGGRNFRKRVVAARIALEMPDDAHFALVTTAPNLGKESDTDDLIEQIRSQTIALGWTPKLIVVDTLSRSTEDMNESSSQDVMRFVRHAEKIISAFGAVVMPVHHCGKDETKGMRGSSALHGSADAEWMVAVHADTGARQLSVEKMKDGPDKGKLRYDLVDVPLGEDAAGERIVTCFAKLLDGSAEVPPEQKVTERGHTHEATILIALKLLASVEGKVGSVGAARRSGQVVAKARFKEVVASADLFASTKSGAVAKALRRAWDALEQKAVIDQDDALLCLLEPAASS